MIKFIAVVLAGMLALVVVALATTTQASENAGGAGAPAAETPTNMRTPPPSPGPPAPDFELAMGNGTTVRLSDLRGNVVVLDFWATWCGPCMRALPGVDAFAKWAGESGEPIKVYAVHTWEKAPQDQTIAATASLWDRQKFSTLVLFDWGGAVARRFNVPSIPTTIIVGTDGRIVTTHTAFPRSVDIAALLRDECLRALGAEPAAAVSNSPEVNRAAH